jgi:hypothetical protein
VRGGVSRPVARHGSGDAASTTGGRCWKIGVDGAGKGGGEATIRGGDQTAAAMIEPPSGQLPSGVTHLGSHRMG